MVVKVRPGQDLRRCTIALLLVLSSPGVPRAAPFAISGSFHASDFRLDLHFQDAPPSPYDSFSGSFSDVFDDAGVTGIGLERLSVSLDMLSLAMGSGPEQPADGVMQLLYSDGQLRAIQIGGPANGVFVSSGTDDFSLTFVGLGLDAAGFMYSTSSPPAWYIAQTLVAHVNVPEPSPLLLLALGLVTIRLGSRRTAPGRRDLAG
jgi:hypothetical protein